MQVYHDGTTAGAKSAIGLFERAIEKDGNFAAAFAGLAQCWTELRFTEDYASVMTKADEAAHKAVELGPNLAEAHFALAKVSAHLDRDVEAISEGELALGINPNLSEGNVVLGWLYLSLGNTGKALSRLSKAQGLDPLSPGPGIWLATALYIVGRFDEAMVLLEKLREFNPSNPEVYRVLGECHLFKKEFSEAQKMFDISVRISPQFDLRTVRDQGILFALTGRPDDALAKLEEANRGGGQSGRMYAAVFIQAALGDMDKVFQALDASAETHSWPIELPTHALFADVRKDPRFKAFIAKTGVNLQN